MRAGRQFVKTVIAVFLLMAAMIIFTFRSFYLQSKENIEALGQFNLEVETTMIQNYLNKGLDVLWVTADTVDNMINTGRTNEEILNYLTTEAEHEKEQVDENFTGIYGYINGEYLDGIGWEPPEGYDPKSRDWYVAAIKANGQTTLVPPYLDAQTNTIMISVSKMLSDNESVVSIDIALNEIQSLTEQIQLDNMGYGFIVDSSGLVVAHFDESEKGKVYPLNEEQTRLMTQIYSLKSGSCELMLDGEKCRVFIDQIGNDWYVVMVVSNTKLFHGLRTRIIFNAIVCIVIFFVIVLFCYFAYQRIQIHQKNEELSRQKIDTLNSNIIKSLAYTIDAKDRYTSGHSQRVANYSKEIARRMGKSAEEQNLIYYAGLLHDVGKIRVPEDVINKPGKLSEEEFNLIKMHPVSGYHIMKDIYDNKQIALGAKYHHEKYDGTGYPNGLYGENIPEIARIIGIADAYDAMASNRSYRNALPQKAVREEIERCSGTQFDPEIAKIMLEIIDEDKEYNLCQHDDMKKNILVVDDEVITYKLVKKILSEESLYTVFKASDYDELMSILENTNIHLILLDIVMPDMDGFEIYEKIKERCDIPIVFVSGDKNIDNIIKATELGAADYVTKPFVATALLETVHGVVNIRGN